MSFHPNSDLGRHQAYIDGDKCQCGKRKKAGNPFCWDCFKELSPKTRAKVSGSTIVSEQSLQAFEDAKEEL